MVKFLHQKIFHVIFLLVIFLSTTFSWAQNPISITTQGTPVVTNFNGWGGIYPTGFSSEGATNSITYRGTSTSTQGGTYAVPGAGFGHLASSSANRLALKGTYKNDSGSPITKLEISYKAYTITNNTRTPGWAVTSSAGTISPSISWTYNSSNTVSAPAILTGIINLSTPIETGGTFTISFETDRGGGSGSSPMVGLNDISVNNLSVPAVLAAPVATAATENNTGSSFVANWEAVTGATGYRLDVATDDAFVNKLEDYDDAAVSGTSKLVNLGIQPNTTYHYRVRAERNAETSVNSNVIDVVVGTFVLQAPVTIAGSGILTDGFMANWEPTAGATGYYLDVSTSPDFGNVLETYTTETFTNMPQDILLGSSGWTGNGGITWVGSMSATNRVHAGTTDRLLMLWLQGSLEAQKSHLLSGEIQGDFNSLTFDAYKVLNNGSNSTVTASVLSGTNFETVTVLGTQITPSNTTTKNTFTKLLPDVIPGPYKIKIEVTDNPTYSARTGIDNVKFGSRVVTGPLLLPGYDNLDVGNVTSYLVTGLQPGTKYYYRVRAYTATETSGNSNVTDVITGCITVTPPTAAPLELCTGATVADLALAEENVHWFAAQTGGTELAETATVASGTYYASLFTGNCESPRVAVTVVVRTTPAPVAAPVNICGAGTVADLILAGTDLKWYADATTETALTPETAVAAGTYYVTQTLTGCESTRTAITVTVTAIPAAITADAQLFCGTATASQLLPAIGGGTTITTENFDMAITGGISGSHTFSTGVWTMQNGGSDNLPGNVRSGSSIRFASFHRYTSPEFDNVKSIRFYARAASAKTLEIKKIVGSVETVLQTIALTTTMQQYSVDVNETGTQNVKISFFGQQNQIVAYLDDLEIIMSDGSPEIKWYADETGDTALTVTEALATGDYYVAQSVNGCEGPRTQVAVTVNTIPAEPVATALILCGTPTVAELTATGDDLKWYAAETGGTALADTEAVVAGNYYVSQTVNGCESPRAEVAVTINPVPAAPTTLPLTFCGSATIAELTAETTGTGLKWYAEETGGVALADTETVSSATYYVSQTVDTCESPRAAVVVTVSELPAGPVVEALSFCGTTLASQLPVAGGTDLKWYIAETGGTALVGTENIISGDYYVSQTVDGCESLRIPVAVIVNPIPAAPSIAQPAQTFCGGKTVADLVPADPSIKWYTVSANGTALEGDTVLVSGLSVYYASQTVDGCESTARTAVAVMVNTTAQPVANGNYTFCNNATVADLDATGTALKWYAEETDADALADTAAIATGTYYVSQTLNGCESTKLAVEVTVNEVVAPVVDPITLCGASTAADLNTELTDLKWYVSNTAMDELADTAVITSGTYYAAQTTGTCESLRTPVVVTVNTTAVINAGPFSFCNEATVEDLDATGTDVKWYVSATATDAMADADALATGTYYLTQTINGCESAKTAVTVTVTNPVAAGASPQQYNTGETLADLEVTGPGIVWYADEELTQVLPATTVLTDWAVYYAVPNEGACTGEALAVQVDDLLGNAGFDKASFKYYPNPVKDMLNISYSENVTGVEVYNMLGQVVINRTPNAAALQVDMGALQAGTYIVKLQAGNSTQTLKVVKQ